MDDNQIFNLIGEYLKERDLEYQLQKEKEFAKLKTWFENKFEIAKLNQLSVADILEFVNKTDMRNGNSIGFWRIGLRQNLIMKMTQNIIDFRTAIEFLLNDKESLEYRIREIRRHRGPYRVPTLGGEHLIIATAFLVVNYPESIVGILSLSEKEELLRKLNRLPQISVNENPGSKFVKMNNALIQFKNDFEIANWNNYHEFPMFLWKYIRPAL